MNLTYGRLGRIAKIAIATGALLLASATSSCRSPGTIDAHETLPPTTKQRISCSLDALTRSAVENKSGKCKNDSTGLGTTEYFTTNELGSVCITTTGEKLWTFNYSGEMPYSNTRVSILDDIRDGPGFSKNSLDYSHFFDETAETSGRKIYHFGENTSESDIDKINERYLRVLEYTLKEQQKQQKK